MKDFIHIRIKSRFTKQGSILELLKKELPKFKWRQGDSDAQGPYISGKNDDAVQVMLWLGEQPSELTVSFATATSSASENSAFIDELLRGLVPLLGEVIEARGID